MNSSAASSSHEGITQEPTSVACRYTTVFDSRGSVYFAVAPSEPYGEHLRLALLTDVKRMLQKNGVGINCGSIPTEVDDAGKGEHEREVAAAAPQPRVCLHTVSIEHVEKNFLNYLELLAITFRVELMVSNPRVAARSSKVTSVTRALGAAPPLVDDVVSRSASPHASHQCAGMQGAHRSFAEPELPLRSPDATASQLWDRFAETEEIGERARMGFPSTPLPPLSSLEGVVLPMQGTSALFHPTRQPASRLDRLAPLHASPGAHQPRVPFVWTLSRDAAFPTIRTDLFELLTRRDYLSMFREDVNVFAHTNLSDLVIMISMDANTTLETSAPHHVKGLTTPSHRGALSARRDVQAIRVQPTAQGRHAERALITPDLADVDYCVMLRAPLTATVSAGGAAHVAARSPVSVDGPNGYPSEVVQVARSAYRYSLASKCEVASCGLGITCITIMVILLVGAAIVHLKQKWRTRRNLHANEQRLLRTHLK